jgi:hypothetical protein
MKLSVVIAVVVAMGVVVGGGYVLIQQREVRVEVSGVNAPATRESIGADRARQDIGTYQEAKHPSFPGSEKKE